MSKYKRIAMLVSSLGLILLVIGISYSFFNYTRTGQVNNLGTGQMYFNTTEGPTLNLTNLFPMTSEEAGEANLDSVSVVIEGNTTYADGEEYEITLVDVTNTVNGKSIPLNYTATYTPNTDKVIGTASNDYWNAREDKDANLYLLNATGEVEEGKQVLVGYVDNGATGIEGTLTIKAYIDADRIAISDTYAEGHKYILNNNMTQEELNACISIFNDFGTGDSFCHGIGTQDGLTFQEVLDMNLFGSEALEFLTSNNIIIYVGDKGTTTDWVDGRVVLTETEWNSLNTAAISFKIRAESNEGIWVENPLGGIVESCPDCKFVYYFVDEGDPPLYTTWNMAGKDGVVSAPETPSVLTDGLYDDYRELVSVTGKNVFLGVTLNSNNQVTNAYVCGIKNKIPFCLKGTLAYIYGSSLNESIYSTNTSLLQSELLYNNTCRVTHSMGSVYYTGENDSIYCGEYGDTSIGAHASLSGDVYIKAAANNCFVFSDGSFGCEVDSDWGNEMT